MTLATPLPPGATVRPRPAGLAPDLAAWLDAHADALDTTPALASGILPRLAQAGLPRIGVPGALGGAGGTTVDAIEAIAAVARHSLTAAFVLWGHRAFIEYLLQSANDALRARWLPALLNGEYAGATGLSNAMKYLSNIESLQMRAEPLDAARTRFALSGALPWITNLRREGFVVAAAFDQGDAAPPAIFAIPHDAAGVTRGDDLDLIALRASSTAALNLDGTVLDAGWQIAPDARAFLAHARPAFLGLQCGMSIGLARRALESVDTGSPSIRDALAGDANALRHTLDTLTGQLYEGVASGAFVAAPAAQFDIRIGLARIVAAASQLDVQAAGGRGYLRGAGRDDVARRAREAAFVPIVTPSVVQLNHQLAQYRRGASA